jgi:hypothetical protein
VNRPLPDWFLDWKDHPVVIVASGPSAKDYDYNLFRDKAKFIAINKSLELVPWADVLLAADAGWWHKTKGMKLFTGLKVTLDFNISRIYDVKLLSLSKTDSGIIVKKPGQMGNGRNSGFYAINLAIQFGAKKIILSGFDMTLKSGVHWHGPHDKGLNNPRSYTINKWREILDKQSATVEKLGVKIINVSMSSALKAYPKMTLLEALS